MSVVTNGAELVRKLRETGTGESKLAIARKVLQDVFARDKRHATAEEVLDALRGSSDVTPATVAKAEMIAETGFWSPAAVEKQRPIEDVLLWIETETAPATVAPPAKASTKDESTPNGDDATSPPGQPSSTPATAKQPSSSAGTPATVAPPPKAK